MTNRVILSPFSLDTPVPALTRLVRRGWVLNRVDVPAGASLPDAMHAIHARLAGHVEAAVAGGTCPVSIAGDCLQAAAVLAGLARHKVEPTLVWLDAHGDFNTPESSPSGFVGGMPLAMLVGRGEAWLRENAGLAPFDERRVVLAGARDLDEGEARNLEASLVTQVTRLDDLLAAVPADRPVYVHFDTDIIDPAEAPAMLYAVPGGPSLADVRRTLDVLGRARQIAAVSMTTWTPDRDPDGSTERACMRALGALVGEI